MQTGHKLSLKSLLYLSLALVLTGAAIWQLNAGVSAHSASTKTKRTVAASKQQQSFVDKASARVAEITAALKALAEEAEQSGKSPAIVEQISRPN